MGLLHYISLIIIAFMGCSANAQEPSVTDQDGRPLLTVTGQIKALRNESTNERAIQFNREMLNSLPRKSLRTSTVVTDGVRHFEGFLMRDLLERVNAEGEIADAFALNDYVITIPIKDFYTYDVLIADTMDGTPLTSRDKGPLWIVYPRDQHRELQDIRYDYRWVWQLHRLDIR